MKPFMKSIETYSVDDVALWLFCQGMGETAIASFRRNDIDGGMLTTLTQDELVNDLGLTQLQAKKVQRSIEFTLGLTAEGPPEIQELKLEVARLHKENEDLKDKLSKFGSPLAPEDSTIPVTTAVPIVTPSAPNSVPSGRKTNHYHTAYAYHTAPTYPTAAPTGTTNHYCTETASPYVVPQTSKPSKSATVAKGAVRGPRVVQ
jgi:SAM domain (Sterile alpha motif)